jgi:hypothetical protein
MAGKSRKCKVTLGFPYQIGEAYHEEVMDHKYRDVKPQRTGLADSSCSHGRVLTCAQCAGDSRHAQNEQSKGQQ